MLEIIYQIIIVLAIMSFPITAISLLVYIDHQITLDQLAR